MTLNTKALGNKAEIIVISEFIKNDIPVSLPFGDNQPYDLVIDTPLGFKSVQVKHGLLKNGVIIADIRKRIGNKRVKYTTYDQLVDYLAIWCEQLNTCYLLDMNECNGKTMIHLRVVEPKNNSCITTVKWASDYEFSKKVAFLK